MYILFGLYICRLELLGEGNYGRFDKSTQEWDGMMRDLFDGVGRIFHKTTDFSPQGIVSRNSCENEFADIPLQSLHCNGMSVCTEKDLVKQPPVFFLEFIRRTHHKLFFNGLYASFLNKNKWSKK